MDNNLHFANQVRHFISNNYIKLSNSIFEKFDKNENHVFNSKTFQKIYNNKQQLVVYTEKEGKIVIDESKTKSNIKLQLHKKRKNDSKYYIEELEDICDLLKCDIAYILGEKSGNISVNNGIEVFYILTEKELQSLIDTIKCLTNDLSNVQLVFVVFPIFGLSGIINITKINGKYNDIDISFEISCAIKPKYNEKVSFPYDGVKMNLLDFEGSFYYKLNEISKDIGFDKYKCIPFLSKSISYFYENTYKISKALEDGNDSFLKNYKKSLTDREYFM